MWVGPVSRYSGTRSGGISSRHVSRWVWYSRLLDVTPQELRLQGKLIVKVDVYISSTSSSRQNIQMHSLTNTRHLLWKHILYIYFKFLPHRLLSLVDMWLVWFIYAIYACWNSHIDRWFSVVFIEGECLNEQHQQQRQLQQCLWCYLHDRSHCKSSPGLSDECRLSAGWPPTLRPIQSTLAVSLPKTGSYHPHPSSPLLLLLSL